MEGEKIFMKKKPYISEDEINLIDLYSKLWKEKIIILFLTSIFILLSYFFYLFNHEEKFIAEIQINPKNVAYTGDVSEKEFTTKLYLNLSSQNNLENYIEQSKEMYEFKSFLESKNYNLQKYFNSKTFGLSKSSNFFIIFPKKFDGVNFINNYAEYIINLTINEFRDYSKLDTQKKISHYEKHLDIAKKLLFENPFPGTVIGNDRINNDYLFLEGSKFIEINILLLKKKIMELESTNYFYGKLFNKAYNLSPVNSYLSLYLFLGFISGFFLSLLIISLKKFKNKKYKN
jgi:LPS O-antigen subunit length determinant protein (WzzB/FepE family)